MQEQCLQISLAVVQQWINSSTPSQSDWFFTRITTGCIRNFFAKHCTEVISTIASSTMTITTSNGSSFSRFKFWWSHYGRIMCSYIHVRLCTQEVVGEIYDTHPCANKENNNRRGRSKYTCMYKSSLSLQPD